MRLKVQVMQSERCALSVSLTLFTAAYSSQWLSSWHWWHPVFSQSWLVREEAYQRPNLSLTIAISICIFTYQMLLSLTSTPCGRNIISVVQNLFQ